MAVMDIGGFIASQPVLTGLVGAAVAGGAMFALRQAPKAVFERLRALATVTLVVESREEAFKFVTGWLAEHKAVDRARNLMMAELYDYNERRWRWRMTLGRGWHALRYRGTWIFVHREVKEAGEVAQLAGVGATQRLWLISLGRSQAALRALIEQARADYYGEALINVHFYLGQGWACGDRRPPRSLDTVFMPADQKARIVADLAAFLAGRETYQRRGIPWRRGYLFKGPPGTGKTTMIFALASHFRRPVYSLNLNQVKNDGELLAAFNGIDSDGVVVLEDIDTVEVSRDRDLVAQREEASALKLPIGGETKGVTLSGLLNAIDGLAAREGRLLFLTSNHADQLDPALVRPGRVDLVEEIAPLDRSSALQMVEAFGFDDQVLAEVSLPVAAAELQGLLIRRSAAAENGLAP
jgi:chaperone BCS1